jgi:chromosome segregation ATPase
MDKLFQDLERLFEIEALLSDLENACKESQEAVAFETGQLRYAKVQLLSLESPDFFLRLMPARLEKKKELAQAEVRAHTAALEEARRELESRRFTIDTLKEEYQSLLPRREEYAAGAGSFPEDLEQHLVCASGIRLAERILHSLSQAPNHMTG